MKTLLLALLAFPSLVHSFLPVLTQSLQYSQWYKDSSFHGTSSTSKFCASINREHKDDSIHNTWNISRLLQLVNTDSDEYSTSIEALVSIYTQATSQARISTETQPFNDIVDADVPNGLKSMKRFLRSSNQNHEGCFKIFQNNVNSGTELSLPPSLLFSMDEPLKFLQEHLCCGEKGGLMYDENEVVVVCAPIDQNARDTSRILDGRPLARLQMGTLPDAKVTLDAATVQKLEQIGALEIDSVVSMESNMGNVSCQVSSDDLDVLGNILSLIINKGSQYREECQQESHETLVKLIDCAVESTKDALLGNSDEPHLVIVAHCTNASMVASALSSWKRDKIENSLYKKSRIEDLLYEAVTVVTIGSTCQSFCNGPAYIHVSMYDDVLSQRFGVSEKNQKGGGKHAIYMQTWSPFHEIEGEIKTSRCHDAHNMNACAIQFLYLVMRVNGVRSFRELYNEAKFNDPRQILDISPRNFAIDYGKNKLGELVIAPNMDDELLPAMIHASGAAKLLWCKDDSNLPDDDEAKCYLEEYFGYSAFEEIRDACSETIGVSR